MPWLTNVKEHYNHKWVNWFGACAMTFGKHIFYDCNYDGVPLKIRKHEYKHVEQYSKYGIIGFLMIYFYWYLKGRLSGKSHWQAYDSIPFEIEAVKAQGEPKWK